MATFLELTTVHICLQSRNSIRGNFMLEPIRKMPSESTGALRTNCWTTLDLSDRQSGYWRTTSTHPQLQPTPLIIHATAQSSSKSPLTKVRPDCRKLRMTSDLDSDLDSNQWQPRHFPDSIPAT
ncbi:PREDICTED: uncharacterized protein LOC109183068 [Ipomoea nil]|uniref:uncharacterized protein LOC109183068 n=1 Tax=Ipomoea nil TaxID=35883 RepID=UPI0009009EC1|nr:PREDICTED: uncharacterized protein LOC109183068 [Ipomoea nil]